MAPPASLLYWHRMEGALQPEVGPLTAWEGDVAFDSAKFGNGGRSTTHGITGGRGSFPIATVWPTIESAKQGCVEFWLKMLVNFSEQYDSASVIGNQLYSSGPTVAWVYFDTYAGGRVLLFTGEFSDYWEVSGPAWGAGELHHFAYSWDANAASENQMLFFDGSLVASRTYTLNIAGGWDTTMYLLSYLAGQGLNRYSLMDNLKIWNYRKTDMSDRFTEGYGTPGRILTNRFNRIEGVAA